MYNDHAIKCQRFAQKDDDCMMLVILMVALSIKQPWDKVGIMLEDVMLNGISSRFLNWKMKQDTYNYLLDNKDNLYKDVMFIMSCHVPTDEQKAFQLMKIFLRIPGIGISKAGFCCQLVAGLVGCMDSWNIKYYKINPNTLDYNKGVKTDRGRKNNDKKITDYITVCHDIGTSRLWDTWCNMVATAYGQWSDGNEVSKAHIDYLLNAFVSK